jgi:hypothetical protein
MSNWPVFKVSSGSAPNVQNNTYLFEETKPVVANNPVAYMPAGNYRGHSNPRAIPGLIQWIDFSNPNAVVVDSSGNISQGTDLSGNGNHFFQIVAANRPTYITSSAQSGGNLRMGEKNVARLDVTANTHFIFSRTNQRMLPVAQYSLFIAARFRTNAGTSISAFQGIWIDTASSTWNTGFGVTGNGAANTVLTWADNYLSNFIATTLTGTDPATIITAVYDKVVVRQYITGSSMGTDNFTGNITHGTTLLSGSVGCYLGADSSPASTFGPMSGAFGEVILYDRALSLIEVNDINRYLSQKWGILATLT